MNPRHVLEGLDELSIDNLKFGRITKEAMAFAVDKALCQLNFDLLHLGSDDCTPSNRILADELNDLLEAARQLEKENEK